MLPVKAYVINLSEDIERRDHSAELLQRIGLEYEIIQAVRPNASTVGRLRNEGMRDLVSLALPS